MYVWGWEQGEETDPGDDLVGVGERGVAVLAAVDCPRRRQAHQEQPPHSSLPPITRTHLLFLFSLSGPTAGELAPRSRCRSKSRFRAGLDGCRPAIGPATETGMGENVCKFVGEENRRR